MWQLIAKGVLGGIGGGMKAAAKNPEIKDNATTTQNNDNNAEQETGAAAGNLLAKVLKRKSNKEAKNG